MSAGGTGTKVSRARRNKGFIYVSVVTAVQL
jgi:hypothetical protein